MSITVPATQIRQAVAESDTRGRREAVRERRAQRERHRAADERAAGERAVDETGETDQWDGARTPEAQALLLSRAVALGLDGLLYGP